MKKVIAIATLSAALVSAATAGEKIVCEGSSTVGPLAKAFAEYYMSANPGVQVTVSESGSGNGAKALTNSSCDVGDLSRPMKNKEVKACVSKDVVPVPHVIALDGIAVVVNKKNKVKALKLEQVRDIYLGKITNWKEVGGPNSKIIVITRDTNSGTFETFEKLVMSKQKIVDKAEVVGSNGQARTRVQSTAGAVGFVGLGFVKGVKALDIDGVEPKPETIQNGSYPIARPLFMYTNGFPKMGSHLYNFINTYLSEDGQEIVEEIGFVPVTSY